MTGTVTDEDLSLFALRLLDETEALRVHRHVQLSTEARQELQRMWGDLALLSLAAEPQHVPDTTRQRFISAVAREPRYTDRTTSKAGLAGSARPPVEKAPLKSLSWFLPWSGWAVAAALAVTAWFAHQRTGLVRDQLRAAQEVALHAEQASAQAQERSAYAERVLDTLRSRSAQRFVLTKQTARTEPTARVTYVASTGSLLFQGSDLAGLPPSRTYELWLIPVDKAAKPVPAGIFKPDARGYASLIMPPLPKGIAAATFGVTVENAHGTESPTLPILLIGS